MKTIGLIGGMSWESTQTYYRLINQAVREQLGGLHSARIILYSLDFAEIEIHQRRGEWGLAADILIAAARSLEKAGADFVLICTNTMHKVAPDVEAAIGVPLLHIMDATAAAIASDGLKCVGLLGTRFTMEQSFCSERLEAKGIRVLVPGAAQRERIHQVIFEELCQGVTSHQARSDFLAIIDDLVGQGAQAVILGCTEIGLLIGPQDTSARLYDTTEVHVDQAVKLALATDPVSVSLPTFSS
jgi:aspartate racemase